MQLHYLPACLFAYSHTFLQRKLTTVTNTVAASEASCTIEASARIYACRVDCVHTDTYRVLGGLNSADVANEEDGPPGEDG